MSQLVLGTAGHIDHGKSSLVKALTGVDPDRLKEERRRGITIELGFAELCLGEDRSLSFVDVPGHEKFVRHMVAGATGIDAVLLVVAADQGVQPQTIEHLEICSLLGLQRGVVALTKCDLVDPDLQEVVTLELADLLAGTFLESVSVIPVSASTGAGLDELRAALTALFNDIPMRARDGLPRLPIDRSFPMKGFGTVVTGTLVGGVFSVGDEIEIQPGSHPGRIRGVHVHNTKVSAVSPGTRTAMNLQSLDCANAPRGAVVTRAGSLLTTRRAWATLSLLASAPDRLRKGGPARLHHGTCDRAVRISPLGEGPGGDLHIELYFDESAVLAPGDRYILRRPAPVDTVGGGVIVDVSPPAKADYQPADFEAAGLAPAAILVSRLTRAGAAGRERAGLAAELGLSSVDFDATMTQLEQAEGLIRLAGRLIDRRAWDTVKRQLIVNLERFHTREPLRLGMAREDLRVSTERSITHEGWRLMLEGLVSEGAVRIEGEWVALSGHEVVLGGDAEQLADRIETDFLAAALEPPLLEDVIGSAQMAQARDVVDLLIARGKLVRIQDGKLFHSQALDGLRRKLGEYARTSKTIDVAAFKTLAGVTRKHAIPLLEQLDVERTTRRVGNLREILIES